MPNKQERIHQYGISIASYYGGKMLGRWGVVQSEIILSNKNEILLSKKSEQK